MTVGIDRVGCVPEVLAELRAAAAVKRTARHQLADATAEHGQRSSQRHEPRRAHEAATDLWVQLVLAAHAAGHPIADIARAAGVAPASVHYRLQQAAASD